MNPAKIEQALAKAQEADKLADRIHEVEQFLAAIRAGKSIEIKVTPPHIGTVTISNDPCYADCQNSIHGQPREPMATMAIIVGTAALEALKAKLEAIVIEN